MNVYTRVVVGRDEMESLRFLGRELGVSDGVIIFPPQLTTALAQFEESVPDVVNVQVELYSKYDRDEIHCYVTGEV